MPPPSAVDTVIRACYMLRLLRTASFDSHHIDEAARLLHQAAERRHAHTDPAPHTKVASLQPGILKPQSGVPILVASGLEGWLSKNHAVDMPLTRPSAWLRLAVGGSARLIHQPSPPA